VEYIESIKTVLARKRELNFVSRRKWIEGSFVKID
jgi:hypothetical protein